MDSGILRNPLESGKVGENRKSEMFSSEKTELMLKDYLRDDLSSCSSSGFKSFPRWQCCTTVRFLLEIDLKANCDYSDSRKSLLKKNKSRSRSALQRASEAVLSAVKELSFSSSAGIKRGILLRSFSRKLSFWKKRDRDEGDAGRSEIFSDFLKEIKQSTDQNTAAVSSAATAEIITPRRGRVSRSTGNNWSESEFTGDVLLLSSGESENFGVTDGNEVKIDLPAEEIGNRVGGKAGEDSVNGGKHEKWRNDDGKEQFSPVSVLENPFHDDKQEENDSPLQCHSVKIEGSKQKVMQKVRRIESLARMEPVDLGKKWVDFSEDGTLCVAEDLLEIFKAKTLQNNLNVDSLILDFFVERIGEDCGNGEVELLKTAEEWFNGRFPEAVLGWEVVEGRRLYFKDMERKGGWRSLEEEREVVAAEMEVEVLDFLVEELLVDL